MPTQPDFIDLAIKHQTLTNTLNNQNKPCRPINLIKANLCTQHSEAKILNTLLPIVLKLYTYNKTLQEENSHLKKDIATLSKPNLQSDYKIRDTIQAIDNLLLINLPQKLKDIQRLITREDTSSQLQELVNESITDLTSRLKRQGPLNLTTQNQLTQLNEQINLYIDRLVKRPNTLYMDQTSSLGLEDVPSVIKVLASKADILTSLLGSNNDRL
ncbi:MAG: hypothetical protein EOM67_03615 [Spirochaetia bacterium]|nr:hypothetical protein [Spirochaetia bacterium]